ncbi:unnamed protein product [Pleuronectes platessa]|uniref:Uncharacterized protein n=1 Tax=Pleuronectes platessa TaxID=8262 RepID=A0A9N7VHZ0_PLEPL|nr:unnamed protein product [Pleuronectes platessa]
MSEDNHSHYRLDPNDRLNGLGQRRKRPKKMMQGVQCKPEGFGFGLAAVLGDHEAVLLGFIFQTDPRRRTTPAERQAWRPYITTPAAAIPTLHRKTFILWLCPLQQLTTL